MGASLLVAAVLAADVRLCLAVSGVLWSGAYALLAWHMLALLLGPRRDGAARCAGIRTTQNR